jgi:hypothetical protein
MKYMLLIVLLFMLAACNNTTNTPLPIEHNSATCEKAYDFKHSTTDTLPVSCYVVDDRECCLWKLDAKTNFEMCLDEHCIWDPSG